MHSSGAAAGNQQSTSTSLQQPSGSSAAPSAIARRKLVVHRPISRTVQPQPLQQIQTVALAAAAAGTTAAAAFVARPPAIPLQRRGGPLFPPSAAPLFPKSSSSSSISTAMAAFRDDTSWAYNSKPGEQEEANYNVVSSPSATTVKRPSAATEQVAADALTGLLLTSPPKKPRTSFTDTTTAELAAAVAAVNNTTTVAGYSPELSKALKSVVKIFTTMASPNFSQPWQMLQQTKCTATGFVISPLGSRRILTNAHAVANQVAVKVRKHGSAQKFNARVLAVGHECDIAMLTVDDDEFWEDVQPLEINGLPAMQESVMVVGFPTGGDNVCVTKGVVSRIDRSNYSHGRTTLLAIQVDAAINSGNSGGPVLLGDHVVGIAFQCLTSGENIGYIIPVPVINHFLEDLERNNGKYTGFCEIGLSWQSLENPHMKAALGMPKGMTGIYITKTEPMFEASRVLRAGDVLTTFNGVEIADDGTFLFREAVRINFGHLVAQQFDGDVVNVEVWRDGALHSMQVRLSTPHQLVPSHSHDIKPSYYIYAGLVFTPLTSWYLRSVYGADWSCKAPIKLVHAAYAKSKGQAHEEVVVLSKVLANDLNIGFQDIGNIQVLRVNGERVVNLAHLAHLINNSTARYTKLELEWNKVIYIDHLAAKDCEEAILEVNAVPAPHSKGLLAQPHPGNTPPAAAVGDAMDASQQQQQQGGAGGGAGGDSDLSDDEVAEASARGGDGGSPQEGAGAAAGAATTAASKL